MTFEVFALTIALFAKKPAVVPMVASTSANAAAATATATVTAAVTASPVASPAETAPPPVARAPGLGAPVLFRGACEPRAGCHIIAAGIVTEAGLQPIACDASNEKEIRAKIAARYFAPGTQLDLYARGAAVGAFEVTGDSSQASGHCIVRADGHRRNVPSTVFQFVALLPEDPVRLAALKFPSERETDAREIVRDAMQQSGTPAGPIELNAVRRFREGAVSVLAVDADVSGKHVLAIAEGSGLDPAKWKLVWSSVTSAGEPRQVIVDALDLGADGHAKILLEREKSGGGLEWTLLRRTAGTWKP